VIAAIADLPWGELSAEQQTIALRAAVVSLSRMHDAKNDSVTALRTRLAELYPGPSHEANELLCELLVFLDEPTAVANTLPLITAASTQAEKLHYLYMLRAAKSGWTLADRATYFQWLREGERFAGAHLMPRFIQWIREDAAESLTDAERGSLAELLAPAPPPTDVESPLPNRRVVKQWQLDDVGGALAEVDRGRSFDRGKAMYAAALCARCHRMATEGTPLGPDLTDVARRFGRRDILISIIDPSRAVDEKYRGTSIVTHDGKVIVGQLKGEEGGRLLVASDPLVPDRVVEVPKDTIELMAPSPTSPMPAGLLDTLSLEEILDLLAYLESGGDPGHPSFQGLPR
jgi:putative heme-binding domain-containing protein